MELYTAFDLHANNTYVAIIDHEGKRVAKKKLPNDSRIILDFLSPHREQHNRHSRGIYLQLVLDRGHLVDKGYKVHLANTAAIKKYKGLKHSDDKEDAFWLAEILRLNILPEGHIYPKEGRAIRDLLRKRGHLVKLRTSLILSLQNII